MKKGVLYTSIVAVFLSMIGCSKYKVASFVMPTWDTQFSAPLFDRTYTLGEILSKDSVKITNGDTTFLRAEPPSYVFTLLRTQNLNGVSVGDNLKIGSVPTTYAAESRNDFSIDPPPTIHYAETDPTLPVGQSVPVPAIPSKTVNLNPDQTFQNFTSATISGGSLVVTLYNGYPAAIDFQNGIDVVDASNNTLVNIPIPGNTLAANQTQSDTISLAGVTLPNDPRAAFIYSSPGSGTTPHTFQSDTLVGISFDLVNIQVSSANAIIPKQPDIVINKSIVLTDGNKVQTASIDTGSIDLTVVNKFQMQIPVLLVIKSLTKQGTPLTLNINLTPKGSANSAYSESIPLSGYVLNMADPVTGAPTDSLQYKITAQVPGSGTAFVDVANTDSVSASFELSGLQLTSFTGEVHLQNPINIATTTQKVDLGDFGKKFSGGVTFGPTTQLELNIASIGFPCLAHITLIPASSTSSAPPVDSVVVDTVIYPNTVNKIVLGQNFVDVLDAFAKARNTIPDEFIIGGSVEVNPSPYSTVGTVKSTDEVTGTGTISMPFDLGITNATFIDTTKKALITDSSTASKLSNVDSGSVVVEVWNGMPLQVTMIGQLIDTTTNAVIMNFPSDSIRIAPADVNSDGSVRDSVFSRNVIALTNSQARNLGNSYMRFFIRVATPPGSSTVPFKKDNDISLKVYGNFAFKVDNNLVGK